jgi:hypothetical protein
MLVAKRHSGMRICFLFNHDQIHQVAHSLPIALALARGGFDGEIIVATTGERMAAEVRRLAGDAPGTRITHVALSLAPRSARLAKLLGGLLPAAKLLIYRDNLDFFRSLDMLVVAEKTSLILKTRYGLTDLMMVHTRHGAGDRAIGFDKASAGFDHVLCSGPKIRNRLIAEVGLPPERISIVGYPKFDLVDRNAPAGRAWPADRGRPITLYNPHPSPHLSSWFRHGRDVLDHFVNDEGRELIFAPHVMLFERKYVVTIDKLRVDRVGRIAERHLRGDNMHIDLGSRASTDMSYTQAADIYLGDASSQIYEFLLRPRPCIFLDSHGVDWRGNPNFRHWEAGEVISGPAELGAALDRAPDLHERHYRAVQQAMFAESFDLDDTPSSERAARVIASLADRRRKGQGPAHEAA